jgi:hypothetical protein
MSTMTESKNKNPSNEQSDMDVRQEVQELKHQIELQGATLAGVDATQAATLAGAQATQAAAHAGTWSTMLAGAGGLVVGLFLALAFAGISRD